MGSILIPSKNRRKANKDSLNMMGAPAESPAVLDAVFKAVRREGKNNASAGCVLF